MSSRGISRRVAPKGRATEAMRAARVKADLDVIERTPTLVYETRDGGVAIMCIVPQRLPDAAALSAQQMIARDMFDALVEKCQIYPEDLKGRRWLAHYELRRRRFGDPPNPWRA